MALGISIRLYTLAMNLRQNMPCKQLLQARFQICSIRVPQNDGQLAQGSSLVSLLSNNTVLFLHVCAQLFQYSRRQFSISICILTLQSPCRQPKYISRYVQYNILSLLVVIALYMCFTVLLSYQCPFPVVLRPSKLNVYAKIVRTCLFAFRHARDA